ncbi:MAG: hypothetical protein U0694_14240 [Anaerolineae bacterium]
MRRTLQDPILVITLILVVLFVFIAIVLPILATVGESFSTEGLALFVRYLGEPVYQNIIKNTLVLGLMVATLGTAMGFLFAYVQVKVKAPFKRFMHFAALVPIISPPFALATAIILMFGRNGMILRGILACAVCGAPDAPATTSTASTG